MRLDDGEGLAPVGGRFAKLALHQVEVGKRTKMVHRLDTERRRVWEIKHLEVRGFGFLPAPIVAVGIAQCAINTRPKAKLILFGQVEKCPVCKGFSLDYIVLEASHKAATGGYSGQFPVHILTTGKRQAFDFVKAAGKSIKLAGKEQEECREKAKLQVSDIPRLWQRIEPSFHGCELAPL